MTIENLEIVCMVIMILGGIILCLGYSENGTNIVFKIGGIMFIVSILSIVFLLGYSDSLETDERIEIAKYEDKIHEQINVIKELGYDKNVDENTYVKERKKLNKYILDYNSAVREYTEKEAYPKVFYFYRIKDNKLITNGTNRDIR